MLSSGETTGVFQLESAGMRRVARALKPSTFSDITAMVALYRPGPMDLINDFIEGKHHPSSVKYPHEDLKQVLQETYGIMVYQEQALQVAHVMAGYSLGEADILRRAIGKKKIEIMNEQHKEFINRSMKLGYAKDVADKVWSYIEKFADYGFNKAHAASYAMVAYQTAYMKVKFPVEYMCAVLSIESASGSASSEDKVYMGIQECKRMNIALLTPDINLSSAEFTLENNEHSMNKKAIRFGFNAIKNVGSSAIQAILNARGDTLFHGVMDFLSRCDLTKVNKKVMECLVKAGAFDAFSNRASILEQFESIKTKIQALPDAQDGQTGLFSASHQQLQDTFLQIEEYPQAELLSFEKELFGFYLTEHPLASALQYVSKYATKKIDDIDPHMHNGTIVWIGGIVETWRTVVTKKSGKAMGFGTISDGTGQLEFVVFPSTYEKHQASLKADTVLLLKGKIEEREEKVTLIVDTIRIPDIDDDISQSDEKSAFELIIPRGTTKEILLSLGKVLRAHPGKDALILLIPNGAEPKRMKLPYTVEWNESLQSEVAQILQA